jgi:hypothetical protein
MLPDGEHVLFTLGEEGNYVDLSPDGKQFVTLLLPPPPRDREPERAQVNVVLNWFADLKQRVPVK